MRQAKYLQQFAVLAKHIWKFHKTQWQGSFAWKATICTAKVNLFDKGEGWNSLNWKKNVKTKILIWHMVSEMAKKWSRARLYLQCNYSCSLYFLVKILFVKKRSLYISACLNLNYRTIKQRLKMWRVQWDGGIYRDLCPIPSHVVILSTLS